jgi:hypothetical protein
VLGNRASAFRKLSPDGDATVKGARWPIWWRSLGVLGRPSRSVRSAKRFPDSNRRPLLTIQACQLMIAPPPAQQARRRRSSRPVLERIDSLRGTRTRVLVRIGGHGDAGKTTLRQHIDGAQVVGTAVAGASANALLPRARVDPINGNSYAGACISCDDPGMTMRRQEPAAAAKSPR